MEQQQLFYQYNVFQIITTNLIFVHWHDFECEWTRYVVTNSNNSGSLSVSGSDVPAVLLTQEIYSLILPFLKTGAFNIHIMNKCAGYLKLNMVIWLFLVAHLKQ